MLFAAVYQSVDAVIVGRRLGPDALASVNILYPVLAVFIGLAVMIGAGGNAKIAVLLGENKFKEAGRILGLIIFAGIILGITGSVVIMLFFPQILRILGTSGELGVFAADYLKFMYPFFAPMILFFILEQSVRNDGHASFSGVVMICMAILNILLDLFFIFILELGVAGAALASGISQSLGSLIFLLYFSNKRRKGGNGLLVKMPNFNFSVISGILGNGSSEFLNSIAIGITTFLFNRIILSYVGSTGIAAFSITQYFITIVMMILVGLGNGIQPVLSYNYGAQKHERVKGTLWRLIIIANCIGVVSLVTLRTQTSTLIALFITGHEEAIQVAVAVTEKVSWSLLFIPVCMAASTFFTALEKAKNSLVIALSRGIVFTVSGLSILPLFFEENGIWITPVFAEGITFLLAIFMLVSWWRTSRTGTAIAPFSKG